MIDTASPDGPTLVPLSTIAELLDIPPTRVRQLLRDRALVAARIDGHAHIPAEMVQDGRVVAGLAGTITVLTDAGFSDEEIIRWLFTGDGDPSDAPMARLRAGASKQVHRRAQIAGF